jgi:uncharacterized protein YqgC (DUF456 family)
MEIVRSVQGNTVAPVEYLYWALTILLILIGFVGSIVPLLPGTTLILAGVILHKFLLPDTITWTVVVWIGVFWFLSIAADIACTLIGTKLFGGTKWGMTGATGGAFAGMFFSLPALLVATLLGAVAAEKIGAKRPDKEAWKAGAGAVVGFIAGTIVRVMCAIPMVGLFAYATITAT